MKKLFKFIGWLLAILIAFALIAYLTIGIWLRPVISTVVPQITKTPASLEKAEVSLLRGKIKLKGFKIGNPAGFLEQNAFELGEISVQFEPTSLFSSKIIIDEIKIDGTKVDAELAKSGKMNLMVLNDNIQEFLGEPTLNTRTHENKPQSNKTASSSKALVVKDLRITNSSLSFAFLNQKTQVKLPDIHEKNIGEKKKETMFDLFADILKTLNTSALREISKASQASVNKLLDSLADRSKQASDLVQGLKAGIKNMF